MSCDSAIKKIGILFFHWISLRLFVSIHNKTNWLTEVNIKVCAARLKSPYPRINLSVKRRVWNRLCGFPIDSHRDVPWGTEGRGGRGKKVTFPELILIRGFRQTKCFDLAALQATSHSDTPLRRHRWHFLKKWTARLAPRRDGRGQGERRATGKRMRGYRCVPADAFEPVCQRLVDGGWQKCTRTVSCF